MGAEMTSGSWDCSILLFREQDVQDQIIEASHGLPSPSLGGASIVFSQRNVSAIMQAILAAPVGASLVKQVDWSALFTHQAGKAINRARFERVAVITARAGVHTTGHIFCVPQKVERWFLKASLASASSSRRGHQR
jgi:hypothetical protein